MAVSSSQLNNATNTHAHRRWQIKLLTVRKQSGTDRPSDKGSSCLFKQAKHSLLYSLLFLSVHGTNRFHFVPISVSHETQAHHPQIFFTPIWYAIPLCTIDPVGQSHCRKDILNLRYCFLIILSPSGLLRDNCLIKAVMSLEILKEPTF